MSTNKCRNIKIFLHLYLLVTVDLLFFSCSLTPRPSTPLAFFGGRLAIHPSAGQQPVAPELDCSRYAPLPRPSAVGRIVRVTFQPCGIRRGYVVVQIRHAFRIIAKDFYVKRPPVLLNFRLFGRITAAFIRHWWELINQYTQITELPHRRTSEIPGFRDQSLLDSPVKRRVRHTTQKRTGFLRSQQTMVIVHKIAHFLLLPDF